MEENKDDKEEKGSGNILDRLEQFNTPGKDIKKDDKKKDNVEDLTEEAPSPWDQEESTPDYSFAPAQQPQQYYQPPEQTSTDQIQEIAESIIEEKWQEFMSEMGGFDIWRDRVNREIGSVKQELVRTQDRFNNLQKAVLGKVSEYNENILNIGTEMKALEKVFEKILEPLTTNIKELEKITERLKK
ncbi:hypothetical protein J4426_00095 [Candidatus Woesearchaeota archaeon]|nr:hypothetical protein [Candidatus Woesearchaeota archaeon]